MQQRKSRPPDDHHDDNADTDDARGSGSDLARMLRALKLSGLKDTLPERLALARQRKMGHAAFLELLLMD